MEDLEKLMESVSEKANEVVALREDKESKQFEIMDTMRKNWNDFFFPVADKLYKFMYNTICSNKMGIYRKVIAWIDSKGEIKTKVYSRKASYSDWYDEDGAVFGTDSDWKNIGLYNNPGVFWVDIAFTKDLDGFDCWYRSNAQDSNFYQNFARRDNYYYGKFWIPHFMTVDGTLKRTEVLKKAYAVMLNECAENCDERISNLKNTLKELSETLSGSTSVTEKEDGTIELTLNGKTYVGTVKEEK